ncbi:AAA family ATPase [Mycolicibacterium diernhoferi]|uniref:AAA+ ATPase domain-containing protein n=1 Tax=Mycolicibacterium diernhoferi TaxID=1801 RepID=A0A2A7NY94_9MYCO|nr:AAA family ATPase [Mycolicibacterium diernhoferi]PEG55569.1 hypothetical protein CRI78_04700 [Mycolicibacterium diernhoferi]QYL20735.1 ATP-binding protein [Mycolicibacterium diernhoferi]
MYADKSDRNVIVLSPTEWDDWFKFETTYYVRFIDADGNEFPIGSVKIGEVGLEPGDRDERRTGYRRPNLPQTFQRLGGKFFSLGQDTTYYENLTAIGAQFRQEYLVAMRDIALDEELRIRAQEEPVTAISLLREVPLRSVQEQFHRLARGEARLTPYQFEFSLGKQSQDPCTLTFSVTPHSRPPSNIHVLIGRNGVGKSTTLNGIARSIVNNSHDPFADDSVAQQWQQLSNVVSVSFSAFDSFEPISVPRDRTKGLTYHYVGLKKVGAKATEDSPVLRTKDHGQLSREMTMSVKSCLQFDARRARLVRALGLLETDLIFEATGIRNLIEEGDVEDVLERLPKIFRKLSSGHKIVLLTVTKLVETVVEKSLVLLDEPEAHLHPPLLSSFLRALSDLLTNRNGIAIVATHSPVVLQEVPSSCVWKLHRSGDVLSASQPRIETFGENVGTLTDEVFGLEVISTGFHEMLKQAALDTGDYDQALNMFEGQLGAEGRAILRAMIIATAKQRDAGR